MSGPGPVQSRSLLLVTWQVGGGSPPMVGLGRLLAERGHDVSVLAPASFEARVGAAGCRWRPFPRHAEFDPSAGRALEDQPQFLVRNLFGPGLAEALLDETRRARHDALVVDFMMRSTLCAAEASGIPTAALVHTTAAFHRHEPPEARTWLFDTLDARRRSLGLGPLERVHGVSSTHALLARCDRALVAMPAEFDTWDPTPDNVAYVGPLFEERATDYEWDLPWDADDILPLVVVGFSSQYMRQEQVLERVAEALASLPVRVLVTTGPELDPAEIRMPDSVAVRRFVPHVAVARHASLVVTHAGIGTLMVALANGVPVMCLPLGRDQIGNAARVDELGLGLHLDPGTSVETLRDAAAGLLSSEATKAAAGRAATAIAEYGKGLRAVAEVERLAGAG